MSTRPQPVNNVATRLIIVGASGRMVARLCQIAHDEERFMLVGAVGNAGVRARFSKHAAVERTRRVLRRKSPILPGFLGHPCADVVIDFSGQLGHARGCGYLAPRRRFPADRHHRARARQCAAPVAPSPGSARPPRAQHVTRRRRAGRPAPPPRRVVEKLRLLPRRIPPHPQEGCAFGTALRLADAAKKGLPRLPDHQILAIRGGDVVGEHTLRFAGPGRVPWSHPPGYFARCLRARCAASRGVAEWLRSGMVDHGKMRSGWMFFSRRSPHVRV